METPEQAEHRRAVHRAARRRYRQRLIARETTEQTQQRLERESRLVRQVRAPETDEVRTHRLNTENSYEELQEPWSPSIGGKPDYPT